MPAAALLLASVASPQSVPIPTASDWTDYGMVIDTGPVGSAWDAIMEGITPCAVVKRGGSYFLYYVGADDYISQKNNIGPAHRSIGVATSLDGVRWTKHAGNPVLTFSSSGNPEEGAVSGGVFVASGGEVVAYYGTNVSSTPTSPLVNADTRLAVSSDGLAFSSLGVVLDHTDSSVWGYGDELHGVGAFEHGGTWYSFYVPNGVAVGSRLGVAWGPSRDSLSSSAAVLSVGSMVNARGSLSIVPLDATNVAIFTNYGGVMTARTTTVGALTNLSAPVASYVLGNNAVVLLDAARRTWFLYYNTWAWMGMKLAPAGPVDTTPPTAPTALSASSPSHNVVRVSWGEATDPDTGIVHYRIYRDGAHVGTTPEATFADSGLGELTTYVYSVSAVNLHGVEGARVSLSVMTPADVEPPRVTSVRAAGDPQRVIVEFDEPVQRASAEASGNYAISGVVAVGGASLGGDQRKVTLATSTLQENASYSLSVSGVFDRAATPNTGSDTIEFTYAQATDLVGYWRLDEASGGVAQDTAGWRNDGEVQGGPPSTTGRLGRALALDGSNQYVEVDDSASLDQAAYGSFTVAAWVLIADVPPNTTNSNWAYALFSGPSLRLRYHYDQRFVATILTQVGAFQVASGVLAPGFWKHVAVVKDDAGKKLFLYVDGLAVGPAVSFSGGLSPPPPGPRANHDEHNGRYRIGVQDPHIDYERSFLKGRLDDVRLYGRALTAGEVAGLYGLGAMAYSSVTIADATIMEGDSGATLASFSVGLSAAQSLAATVDYAVANGTASAGTDFIAASGTLSFSPGSTSRTISVPVIGDRIDEGASEDFFVDLSHPVNANVTDGRAVGTIVDDDAVGISISDVTVVEPASGAADAVFTVSLAPPSSGTVSVDFTTTDDTATAPADFTSTSGTLSFNPNETVKTVSVPVNADVIDEGAETFFVDLSNAAGAAIAYPRGTGTIYEAGLYPVSPCRVLDTRQSGQGPALSANSTRTVVVGGRCGIPESVSAVALNITVVDPTGFGHVRLYPAGSIPPLVSAINYGVNQTRANNAIVPLSAAGLLAVSCQQASGFADLVIDVTGYFQ